MMYMKRIRRPQQSPKGLPDLNCDGGAYRAASEVKHSAKMIRLVMILVGFLLFIVLMSAVSGFHSSTFNQLRQFTESGHVELNAGLDEEFLVSSKSPKAEGDRYLGGLLAAGFHEQSCLSRYQSASYRKPSPYLPSVYFLRRLRKYEELHQRCAPYSDLYNRTLKQLIPGRVSSETTGCRYIVWISYSGLGNKMLTLTSAFLYALLTNRVLLVDQGTNLSDLFCEPFPGTSWLLPLDFPLHLGHDYGEHDKLFFCEDDQDLLRDIPWLALKSDNYFVPSLFLIPGYDEELHQLFPRRDAVFHHLGRYLLHPTNSVWGLITRYYESYLAKADERVGIQIRVFESKTGTFQHVLEQVIGCTQQQKILPDVFPNKTIVNVPGKRSKAILLTSLSSGYSEIIRNMYWEHPATTGEIISVYQPSHEEHQQTEVKIHNMKAWAEMYLLSLTDVLVTSAWSTFGYVAQGLGGLKPWILVKSENRTVPDPPCLLAMSMEPCFHAPPFYDCKTKRGVDTGELVPHVRHCEDMSWGLKVVDRDDW